MLLGIHDEFWEHWRCDQFDMQQGALVLSQEFPTQQDLPISERNTRILIAYAPGAWKRVLLIEEPYR